ncbi:non-homologous end-joining DNA ligase [Streptomyces mayteni]
MERDPSPPAGVPDAVPPMLAVDGEPPTGPWGYEFKWDGYRCCLCVGPAGRTRLTSRNGHDLSDTYPELAGVVPRALGAGGGLVLDGEIVALDDAGRPDFGLLQRRHQRRPAAGLLARVPVTYFAFDVLRHDGRALLDEPYADRRERLVGLGLDGASGLAVPPHYTGAEVAPERLLEIAREHGLEGVIAKRLDSRYLPGRRSRLWVKKALFTTREVVVGGWQPGEGRRVESIGSLLIGAHDAAGRLCYVGRVGSGFGEAVLADLRARLAPLARDTSPFDEPVPGPHARRARWVAPRLVGEVAHRTWTADGRLRHPVWRGLRPDRDPAEVGLPARPREDREGRA